MPLGHHLNCSGPVHYIGRGNVNGMRETLGVYDNMPLDAGHFLTGIVVLLFSGINIFYRLGVNDAETGGLGPTTAYTDRAN